MTLGTTVLAKGGKERKLEKLEIFDGSFDKISTYNEVRVIL